jgi:hypothetical protein
MRVTLQGVAFMTLIMSVTPFALFGGVYVHGKLKERFSFVQNMPVRVVAVAAHLIATIITTAILLLLVIYLNNSRRSGSEVDQSEARVERVEGQL